MVVQDAERDARDVLGAPIVRTVPQDAEDHAAQIAQDALGDAIVFVRSPVLTDVLIPQRKFTDIPDLVVWMLI